MANVKITGVDLDTSTPAPPATIKIVGIDLITSQIPAATHYRLIGGTWTAQDVDLL